jgi:hypothetical protein
MQTNRLFLLLVAALSLIGSGARGDLRFFLTPPEQSGLPNDTLTFSGHLENTGPSELFLNSDTLTLSGSGLTTSDDPYVLNAPLSLPPAGSTDSSGNLLDRFDGDLFTVQVGSTVAPGAYFGDFLIQGGATDSALDVLNRQDFQVIVRPNAVPEPGTVTLLTAGIAVGAGLLLRRRFRH